MRGAVIPDLQRVRTAARFTVKLPALKLQDCTPPPPAPPHHPCVAWTDPFQDARVNFVFIILYLYKIPNCIGFRPHEIGICP